MDGGMSGVRKAIITNVKVESDTILCEVEVAYTTYGTYDRERGNAVLVCHALTGNAQPVREGESIGWWEGLIGPGLVIDTNKYFVICSNVLGSCYGTTGPSSLSPETGRPYATTFPVITIRDMVQIQRKLLEHMGVERLYAVIGGSMGGMQVYEWAVTYPELVDIAIPIATCTQMSAMGIAYNEIARQAICSDPEWQRGFYYPATGPRRGLSIARMVGMITYRTASLFEERFGRRLQTDTEQHLYESTYQIESYLRYQGDKLVDRFDANSYLYLLKAMDTHDISRERGGLLRALAKMKAKVLCVGIHNDLLYPIEQQQEIVATMKREGVDAQFYSIDSKYGHDGFLVEYEKLGDILAPYFYFAT